MDRSGQGIYKRRQYDGRDSGTSLASHSQSGEFHGFLRSLGELLLFVLAFCCRFAARLAFSAEGETIMANNTGGQSPPPRSGSTAFTRLASADESTTFQEKLRRSVIFRWGLLLLSVAILVLLFPHSTDIEQNLDAGSIWSGDTVRAAFSFPLYKDEQMVEREKQRARDSILMIFTPTGFSIATLRDTLYGIAAQADSSTADIPSLSEQSRAWIRSLPDEKRGGKINNLIDQVVRGSSELLAGGVIDRAKSSIKQDRIVVRHRSDYEEELSLKPLFDSLHAMQALEANLAGRGITEEEYAVALELFLSVWQPTYRYSKTLTEEAQQIAANAVPRTRGLVRENQIIVTPGEEITERTALMLQSYERSRRLRNEEGSRWLQLIGAIGHVIILLGLPLIYLYNFRRRIFNDNLQLGIIFVLILMMGFLSWLSLSIVTPLPIEYLVLVPFLSMILAILFDSRTAFYLTVVSCLIVAGIRGADYAVAIGLLSAGVMAAYTVRDIKSRTQLYRSIAYSIFGFTLAILALGLERGATLEQLLLQLGFAGINAIVSPVLTFGAIFLLERIFNIATDLKLLEYDDLNHPLLRQLADKAPGTYQHTLTIARLVESAAGAIGANALQAKVGAYFHDIGKIARSEYFVENQMGIGNKHDHIKPEQSARLIREHVLDGIKIARQYGLPERIIDFIPTHHGTTSIKYFLDKALEENPDVDKSLFHYPGPRPHSRETALVMLADAVEATTRSLGDPSAKKIGETVDQIIKRRFSDGQLDECDLTLADLTKIREAFVKNLVGMAHPRVQYKKEEDSGRHVDDPFGGLGVGKKGKDA